MANPVWLDVAKNLIGVSEVPGPKNNPTIMGWIKRLGSKTLGISVVDEDTAWCGTFVTHCMVQAGITPPKVPVRASAWSTWGANLRADRLAPGAVLVFSRPGGGHVGFYVGEDDTTYFVLGGNQSNAVNVSKIAKARCVAQRWPTGVAVTGGPVRSTLKGSVSENEA